MGWAMWVEWDFVFPGDVCLGAPWLDRVCCLGCRREISREEVCCIKRGKDPEYCGWGIVGVVSWDSDSGR